jgi:hypothetical protein
VTWHLYIGYGLDPNLTQEIVDPNWLHLTHGQALRMNLTIAQYAPNSEIWIGESAAAWARCVTEKNTCMLTMGLERFFCLFSFPCSGQSMCTNAFASSFWYGYAMGTLSQLGYKAFCRQALVHEFYY